MKHAVWVVLFILFLAGYSSAKLTLHFQSPLRNDASRAAYVPHVLGGAGGDYTPSYGVDSKTIMRDEGDGWFVYVWDRTIADFMDWMKFEVSLFPNTADINANNNGKVDWAGPDGKKYEFTMAEFFGTDVEVWIYTDPSKNSFTKSFMAPGSKIVWFRSPWGNKALPQMIFGLDSVLMRFSGGDSSTCGWFYGSVTPSMMKANPVGAAHFVRYRAPHLSVPQNDVVDLSAALVAGDTLFVDGTSAIPTVDSRIGSVGECFDSSRVLHVYHPWRFNSTYKDSVIYLKVTNNFINEPVSMEAESEFRYWWRYEFSSSMVSTPTWNSQATRFNIYRRRNVWPEETYFENEKMPTVSELFPMGVYESWLYTNSAGVFDVSFSPLEPKTIRFLSPWDDKSPSFLVEDDTVKMGPFLNDVNHDTCGWYEGTIYKHVEHWNVLFKQTFGMDYYSMSGISVNGEGVGEPVRLDSMMSLYDTVWVYPYPVSNSAPSFSNAFPGKLGVCPTLTISAMLVDWAGESFADSVDVDFGGIYGGNDYTTVNFDGEEYKTCGGVALGMVDSVLGADGVPHRVDSLEFPWKTCSAAHEIEKWFVPVVVAKGSDGTEYTNATCRDINLSLDAEGFWLADISEMSPKGGFFPLDDFEFLDSAKTIRNPKFDHEFGDNGEKHNYSFAMKISAQFQYVRGQYFEFRGDDDVWVFINKKLVVDIGGCHSPVEGAVNLDNLGLVEGQMYPFQIFFSERNKTGSNFKMRTSINLLTEKTYFPQKLETNDDIIRYSIKKIETEQNLTCDISTVGKVDTTDAESVFILYGDAIKDTTLGPGVNFGGVIIEPNMAGFTIDTAAIVRARALPPGAYMLEFYLSSDLTQHSMIVFEVPEYPLPDIAFADSLGKPFDPVGVNLLMEPVGTGKDTLMAFVAYPVRIMVLYMNEKCVDCLVKVDLKTSDSLSFTDASGNPVTSVQTDSLGYAMFYVTAYAAVNNASFTVSGAAVANTIVWGNINMTEPPVPFASRGMMFDRNGDGVPDSLVFPFSEALNDEIPDTLSWSFGDSLWRMVAGVPQVREKIREDSLIVFAADALLDRVFTGSSTGPYFGGFRYHYTYWDEDNGDSISLTMSGMIEDHVGAILQNAIVTPKSDNMSILTLILSEGTDVGTFPADSVFEFRVWRMGNEVSMNMRARRISSVGNGSRYEVYFYADEGGVLPSVGDSVRLAPGVLKDLSGNVPHFENPWVRIIGGQRLQNAVTNLVTLDDEMLERTMGWNQVTSMVVPSDWSLKDVESNIGLPGYLLDYDLRELGMTAGDSVSLDSVLISWNMDFFSHLGQFVASSKGAIACSDQEKFQGDCTQHPGKIFLAWNGRSDRGRAVGTGVYISKMEWKVKAGRETVGRKSTTNSLGIKRTRGKSKGSRNFVF